jgi:hypothetical protein
VLDREIVGVDAGIVDEHAQIGREVEGRGVGDVEPTDLESPAVSSAMVAPASGYRMVAIVAKPRSANSRAMARPMPRLAPVTRALP